MRLAVVGAGDVGRTVGRAWARAGHEVRFGVRRRAAHGDLDGAEPIGPAIEAAAAVLLAVPAAALPDLLAAHAGGLAGAVVLDATNAVGQPVLHQLPLLTRYVPPGRVYRAFCTAGWEVLAEPVLDGVRADLAFCGPDGPDRTLVAGLIGDVGLRPVYLGGLDAADVVDGVTRLWFTLAFGRGYGRHHGIRVLGRDGAGQ